jgi:hypothetical protein
MDVEREKRSKSEVKRIVNKVIALHRMMGHAHFRVLATAIRDNVILNTGITYTDVMAVAKHMECIPCGLAKWTHPKGEISVNRPMYPLEEVSVDGLGPYQPLAVGGYGRMILAVCTATVFMMGKLVKRYDATTLKEFVAEILGLAKQHGYRVRRLRYDAGRVENSGEMATFMAEHGIVGTSATPEHQEQNPVERSVRTLKEKLAANMCAQAALPASYWGRGALMTIQQHNLTPNSVCESSPIAVIFNRVLDVAITGVHYFGEYVIIPKSGDRKQAIGVPRNELARIIGIDSLLSGGWIVVRMGSNAVPVTRRNPVSVADVRADDMTEEMAKRYMPIRRDNGTIEFRVRKSEDDARHGFNYDDVTTIENLDRDATHVERMMRQLTTTIPTILGSMNEAGEAVDEDTEEAREKGLHCRKQWDSEDYTELETTTEGHQEAMPTRRSGRHQLLTERYDPSNPCMEAHMGRDEGTAGDQTSDSDIDWAMMQEMVVERVVDSEKRLWRQKAEEELPMALSAKVVRVVRKVKTNQWTKAQTEKMEPEEAAGWQAARDKELRMFQEQHMCVQEEPTDEDWRENRIREVNWVHTVKREGEKKARMVCLGNRDPFDGETYAPTVNKCVVWLVIAIAVILALHVNIVDISGAFISEAINRRVFVRIDGVFYRLLKFLYG